VVRLGGPMVGVSSSIVSGDPLWSCCVVQVVAWRLVSVACILVVLVVLRCLFVLVAGVLPSLFFF
jgi:hypothetical protein